MLFRDAITTLRFDQDFRSSLRRCNSEITTDGRLYSASDGCERKPLRCTTSRGRISSALRFNRYNRVAMNRYCVLILFLLVTLLTLACGNSNRRLQSITIRAATNGAQIQFTATGTFSAPPTTVAPLPVDWSAGLLAPPPPGNLDYTLSTQPYVFNCAGSGTEVQVTAIAPEDPGAPISGSLPFVKLVMADSARACP